jgi:alkanesulfonate monooxygenase
MANEPRPIDVLWFLPTWGDGRSVVDYFPDPANPTAARGRRADTGYLRQIAQAADRMGFVGALTPTSSNCEDAWLICTALAGYTERLKFLVAFRPGFLLPTLAAQMAATMQRITDNRVLINIVTGGDADEQQSFGDFLDHDARYERTEEFLDVFRRCWDGKFDYEGAHYQVKGGGLKSPYGWAPPARPAIYFGGASSAAERVAARYTNVYLLWGEPPGWVAERVMRMRELAAQEGRSLRFGIRLHVIAREREEEARAAAEGILQAMTPEQIATAMQRAANTESVGQQRMAALHSGQADMDALFVSPNLWAGIGLVRRGAGTALVGSYDQVAERIREYAQIGLDTFILSGYPHLEECYNVGEELLPRLRDVVANVNSGYSSSAAARQTSSK